MQDEDKKLILEWCGFEEDKDPAWWVNKESEIGIPKHLLNLDLNFYFKYAVPKLKLEWRNWKSILLDWCDELTGDYEKDTEAFGQALLKLIKEVR